MKRYELTCYQSVTKGLEEFECPNGEWVKYSDAMDALVKMAEKHVSPPICVIPESYEEREKRDKLFYEKGKKNWWRFWQ